jgi:D-alanine-D-alanine ligase
MHIGLVYDLRDDYRALGFSEEEVAEFDNLDTIDQLDGALQALGCAVTRVGRGQALAARLAAGERFDLVFSIAEGVRGRSREAQVPALCELFDQPYVFSDPLTMSASLDKAVTKRLVAAAGLPTPSLRRPMRASFGTGMTSPPSSSRSPKARARAARPRRWSSPKASLPPP